MIDATQFSGIVPALQAGTYDYVAAPTTVTKERADNMLFTEGYLNTDFQFLIKKGAPKVEKLEDLKGKIVSVNKGSAYDSWARDLEAKIGWKVESFGTQTDAVQAVLAGRADANVAGNTVIAWAVKNNPQLELSYLHSTGLVWAAALRKDSAELRKTIENAIECMKLDGTIAAMHEKWFGMKPAPGSAAVTVFPGYGVPGMAGYDPTAPARRRKCDVSAMQRACRRSWMPLRGMTRCPSCTSARCARASARPRSCAASTSRSRRRSWCSSSARPARARARCCAAATGWRSRPAARSLRRRRPDGARDRHQRHAAHASAWCSSRSTSIRT